MKIRGNTVGTPIKPKKVLVKCEDLTEEEKAQARANIGAASIDDIDTGGSITVDSELSPTSTNPVQNKVITAQMNQAMTTLQNVVLPRLTPTVSSADNGKVLTVVDGAWVAKENEGGSGVSSWNDLTDKPFYEEGSTETLLEDASRSFSYNSSFGCYANAANAMSFVFEEGKEYVVVWDGEAFTRTAFAYAYADGSACVAVGNPLCSGAESNGDSFAIVCDTTNSYLHFISLETVDTHTVAIYKDDTVIKTLDAKYLPDDHINALIDAKLGVIENGTY